MGSVDRPEDRTFRVNFSGDGAAKLRDTVRDKLKEFMGDYTDDTLVEYVVVLLRNGRRKQEAKNELNVFLGDDSDSFVSWLWDHLDSNLDLYVQPQEAFTDTVPNTEPTLEDNAGRKSQHVRLESEKGVLDNLSKGRHKREWRGLARETTELSPLRSSEVDSMHVEDKAHHRPSHSRRSRSPQPPQRKKRSRHDGRQQMKREAVSQATIDAPRRLLQFAVRDAVGTFKPPNSVKEPSMKRLRSVVATSTGDSSLFDRPRRIQSIANIPNAMATVVKAVEAAAEDVRRVKPSGSVFDRLGRDMHVLETAEHVAEFRDFAVADEYEEFDQLQEQTGLNYLQRSNYSGHVENMNMVETETGVASDLISNNEVYDDDDDVMVTGGRVVDISQSGGSGGMRGENSLMVQYKVGRSADDSVRITRNNDQNQSVSSANTSRKIVNIPVNVNAWQPPYQESRDVGMMENQKTLQENEADAGKPGLRLMKENSNPVTVGNGNAKIAVHIQKESTKAMPSAPGSYTAGRPLEDADSRTIFVSNVHFAATKDNLSRHFNKFGDVLKVIIVTDATTGQPKGSAYVEFMRKEAADNALSLDGTSFMSRILKVVKRSSANQEATPTMTWPRIARGAPYNTPRFARGPFPRGIPGAFRPSLLMKPGARSMQWKRDAQPTAAEGAVPGSANNIVTPSPRSMTYVRTDPKPDGNSGTT